MEAKLRPVKVFESSPPVPLSTDVERGNDGRTEFPLSRRERGSKG